MTRQPVSHRGCWHKINGKATNTGIKLHSPRTGNPFPGKASPQTAPEGNHYSLCNGLSALASSDSTSCRPHALLHTLNGTAAWAALFPS